MIRVAAAEYRYDGGRERYLVRARDPQTLLPLDGPTGPAASWRDYDGEDIFGDYTVDPATGTLTGGRSYQSGLGFADPGVGPQYLHGDQIGTLRAVSDAAGAAAAHPTFTAFGEPVENGIPAACWQMPNGRQIRGAEGLLPAERRR